MLVILQVQVQKVFLSNVHCIQSIPLALTLPENGWRRVSLLVFFHEKLSDRRSYVITGYFIKNGLGDSVWKAFTPCGLTCTTISRLVANLVPILRLLTYQFTVLHCYLSAHAKCAAWLPVQYKINCIRKLYGDVQQLTLLMMQVQRYCYANKWDTGTVSCASIHIVAHLPFDVLSS